MTASDPHRAIDAVWRIESPRLIAGLTRIVRDVGLAEEVAQDALVAALEQWPQSGVPENPGAWLMATAKHRAIDLIRRDVMRERKHEEIGRDLTQQQEAMVEELQLVHHVADAETLWRGFFGGSVRGSTFVLAQPQAVQARIREALERACEPYVTADGIAIPIAANIASARKP